MINVRSPIPLYFQIASEIEERIASGAMAQETQLPNEKELARQYRVSLVTVRSAMRVLFDKRLIVRYPGRGTFVAKPSSRNFWSIASLDDLISTGRESTLRLLAREEVHPPDFVLERLNLSPGATVSLVRTVRETGGHPFMLTEQYQPPDIASRMRKSDFTSKEARGKIVIKIVEERCGLKVVGVRQWMSAEAASPAIARQLGVKAGDPLLVVERDYFTDRGRLIQTGQAHYRTDNYRYVMNLSQVDDVDAMANVYRLPFRVPS